MNFKYSILIFPILLLIGCDTNRSNPLDRNYANKLLINGVENEIIFAEMVDHSKLPANTNYSFDFLLHTGTTTAVYQPQWVYSGIGSYMSFSLWSQADTIGSGTYVIDGMVEHDFSITKAVTKVNVDWSTNTNDFSSYLDGTVIIENLGDFNYEITVNCTDYDGYPVTAYYKGQFYYLQD